MNSLDDFQRCAARIKAVADEHRLRIIVLLLDGAKRVGDLATAMNTDLAQVSHHLSVLREADIAVARKQGRFVEYALHPDVYVPSTEPTSERSLNLGECRLALPPPPTTDET